MNCIVGNVSLNVVEKGMGKPTLLFLHYWGGTHRTWNGVVERLSNTYRCIAYDSRGWGKSIGPEHGYSLAELADDAIGLILQLGVTDFVLVGHSMGAKVAQLLASRRPTGLRGLILVAPATPTPTYFPPDALRQQLHAYDNRSNVLQTIGFLCARTPSPELIEQIVEDSLSGTDEAIRTWPTAGILEDISSEVSKIAIPTLVLAGECDRLDSVEQHLREVLPKIATAELEVIADSGHLIPIDEPERLASAILHFVTKL